MQALWPTGAAAEGRSFYEGKTINLIVSTSPRGATNVAGRLISRYFGKYIELQRKIEQTVTQPPTVVKRIK